jgi:hypothetical protein
VPSLIDLQVNQAFKTFSQLTPPGMNTGHDLLYGYYRIYDVTEDGPTPNVRHYRNYKSIDLERLSRNVVE